MPNKIHIDMGLKNTPWYRFKQIIRWIFTGKMEFDYWQN